MEPSQPVKNEAGPIIKDQRAARPSTTEPEWNVLIDRVEERNRDETSAMAPAGRPRWLRPSLAVGVLLLALFVAWAAVVRVKTSGGIIELVDLPKDAEVFVDGEKVSVIWPGGGKPAVISVAAGKHTVRVKNDGLEVSGPEVTVQAEGRRVHRAIRPPAASPRWRARPMIAPLIPRLTVLCPQGPPRKRRTSHQYRP